MPFPGNSIWVTFPSLLQVIPYHLQGLGGVELLVCVGKTQVSKTDWFGRLSFHLIRASASLFDPESALQKDIKTIQARIFANETLSCWLDMVGKYWERFSSVCVA